MLAFFRRKKKSFWNEFTVLGVFVAVVAAGFMYAAMAVTFGYVQNGAAGKDVTAQAPSAQEYRLEARDVLEPFLGRVMMIGISEIEHPDPLLSELASKTQERLLRLRVPKDERDGHLTFVLLLDQWKRALDGSSPDRSVVLERTAQAVAEHPWVQSK